MLKSLFALVLLAVSFAAAADGISRIRIDDEHLQMQRADGKSPSVYAVSPGTVLELDTSSYKLAAPEALKGKKANSIQLVLGKNEQFSAAWQEEKPVHLLSASTLKPNSGSIAFQGFRQGQEGVVAIGSMEGKSFSVFWVGMFKVK